MNVELGLLILQDLKDNKYPELGWKYDPKKGDNDQAKTGMNVSFAICRA
ncbi:hypothetical protein NXV52_23190 [Bacteroides faecis]|nr:hypothetical protein [Bacteroides faecis]MCS3305819.1 hypothetical protein [Bacteroides faecis]